MPYQDYSFTAYTSSALFGGGSETRGATFTVPTNASVRIAVNDDDSILSGDLRLNEHADDLHVSGATITNGAGQALGNGNKVYGEHYVVVTDQSGNEFRMVRIEQQGTNDVYYAFDNSYGVPSAGAQLTVQSTYDVNKWFGNIPHYYELTGGGFDHPTTPVYPTDPVDNTASICGRLFLDDERDGTERDADGSFDQGVGGQTVYLLDINSNVIATTTTDLNGNYEFNNLEAGRYSVRFTEAPGYDFTRQNLGDNRYDSDADAVTGQTDTIHLRAGHKMDNIDAGLVKGGSISGTVWMDADCDGIQDQEIHELGDLVMEDNVQKRAGFTTEVTVNEAGLYELQYDQIASIYSERMFENEVKVYVNGVLIDSNIHLYKQEHTYKVQLNAGYNEITFEPGSNFVSKQPSIDDITLRKIHVTEAEAPRAGVVVKLLNASGEVVAETVTDEAGNYSFINLPFGEYTIMGVAPDGTEFTIQDAGNNDNLDSDVNANGGKMINLTGNADIDMGLCTIETKKGTASVGDTVWKDWNKNGVRDNGEWGFEKLLVTLLGDTDGDGEVDDVVATTITGFDGQYLFEGLAAGDYAVLFGKPAYYQFTQEGAAPDDEVDSDSDADWGGMTEVFTLSEGEAERDIDAGVVPDWKPSETDPIKLFGKGEVDPVTNPDTGTTPSYNDVYGTNESDRNGTKIVGTDGADRIFDLDGRDEIQGGAGADLFVMALDGDRDEIRDFQDGLDLIDLSAWGVSNFADLSFVQDRAHTLIRYGSESLELKFVGLDALSAADFILAGQTTNPGTDGTSQPGGNTDQGTTGGNPVDPAPQPGTGSTTSYNDVYGTNESDRNGTKIVGTDGADRIFDLDGRDEIQGGAGADLFVMALDGDRDEIRDFQDGLDLIDLSAWGVTNFNDLNFSQDRAHTLIRYGSESLEVKFVGLEAFSADDFILA